VLSANSAHVDGRIAPPPWLLLLLLLLLHHGDEYFNDHSISTSVRIAPAGSVGMRRGAIYGDRASSRQIIATDKPRTTRRRRRRQRAAVGPPPAARRPMSAA